jgi:putative endopeptidase
MDYLSEDLVQAKFDFYGKVLSGTPEMKPRWKRVLNNVNGLLGEAVGKIYVDKHFPAEAKTRMLKLVDNLKLAFKDRISKLSWMSEETKKNALAKLEVMNTKIGYPDKWLDYSSIDITDNYFQNVMNASAFLVKHNLSKAGKGVDRDEWHMTPQTINAYYSPNMNEIVFPAAILQPPFFNLEADDAVNYGAIGVVIGHEMTHGFDDQGCKYDLKGNLQNWWTDQDSKSFETKTAILIDQFAAYNPIGDMHIDGKMTLGENIADNGGLTLAIEAYKRTDEWTQNEKIQGCTPIQRFFLSYGQIWRNNIRDEELMKRVKEDVHSPGKYRVNGGVVNIPEFYEAFSVKEGDKMYLAPEKRASIW